MLLCTKLIKLKLHAAAIEISCYHIIPEKNDLCCFRCVISSLLHGVVN